MSRQHNHARQDVVGCSRLANAQQSSRQDNHALMVCMSQTGVHVAAAGTRAGPVGRVATSATSERELNALLDLNESTFRGELAWEWRRENGANGAYCNWTGIYCEDGKVTRITLQAAGLRGPLPDSLGNLTSLDELWLTENHLDGTLPPSLGKLPKLRMIYLTDNKIEGTVPPEWIGLSDTLVYLDLSGNLLTGPLPEWFSGLTAMKANPYGTLVLGSNRFSGTIPKSWSALGKLYLLNMNYNRDVKGCVPAEWKALRKIDWSIMEGTGLTGYCSTP